MRETKGRYSVLVASGSPQAASFLKGLLPPDRFSATTMAGSAGEARRLLLTTPFDLLLINAPLPDESGTQLAVQAGESSGCSVLLLVKNDMYEQVMYRLEGTGVLCLSKPCNAQMVYQATRMLIACRQQVEQLQQKNRSLQARMEEIRLINRAKWVLIERFKMDEAQAHRTIEKQAMDTRSTRRAVAESILRMYEN